MLNLQFLNRFLGRRRQPLADCVVNRSIRLDVSVLVIEPVSRVQHESICANRAGRIAVEYVVRADAIELETVRSAPLTICKNILVPETSART